MTKNTDQAISTAAQLATLNANYQSMSRDISTISQDIKDIKGNYVTRDEFNLVKWIVFGFVGLILTAFAVVLINFFIPHPPTTPSPALQFPVNNVKAGG